MAQLVLHIDDVSIIPSLRKMLESFSGVTLEEPKAGIDLAIDDIKNGRVSEAKDVDDLFVATGSHSDLFR
jgi:hypothetical protein